MRPDASADSIIVFCVGEPTDKQAQVAEQVLEFVENIDEALSTKRRFNNVCTFRPICRGY